MYIRACVVWCGVLYNSNGIRNDHVSCIIMPIEMSDDQLRVSVCIVYRKYLMCVYKIAFDSTTGPSDLMPFMIGCCLFYSYTQSHSHALLHAINDSNKHSKRQQRHSQPVEKFTRDYC